MTPVTPEDSKSKNNHEDGDEDVFYDTADGGGENKTPAVIEGSVRISSVTTPSSDFETGSQSSKHLESESSPSSLHQNRVKMLNELSSSKKFT